MFPYPCYGGNGIRGYVNSYNRRGHFPLIGRQGALCGNINEVSGDFYATEHCVVVNTFAGVDVNWVIFLLKAMNLNQYATATAQPGLSVATINEVQFCLPPYKEQKRIATTLNMYSKLIDCIDEESVSLSNAINITKSKILDLAISGKLVSQDPADEPAIELLKRINPGFKPCDNSHYGDLPIGWSICTLYDICDTINGLWKGKNPPFVNVGVIRNANFTKDFNLDYSKIEYIDVEQRAFEKRNLEYGDLIVEKSGGSDNFPVGRSILYQGESSKYSFSNFTMALRIKDKNLICSKYLYFVILHKYLSGEMTQMQTQTTGLHNLLSDKYMSMPIPMPPTKEQDRIVDCIEKLLGQANQIKTVL